MGKKLQHGHKNLGERGDLKTRGKTVNVNVRMSHWNKRDFIESVQSQACK